ncbi:hypothetical protein [Paraburkholderia ferrariae]|uniref:hypothetical protein n=1 Tax=Paraburkholderia ferrariae TaxID=386056 RepID=UPI0012EBEADF|nr:hypothetical protein [Paraburkholderia ferrariae]
MSAPFVDSPFVDSLAAAFCEHVVTRQMRRIERAKSLLRETGAPRAGFPSPSHNSARLLCVQPPTIRPSNRGFIQDRSATQQVRLPHIDKSMPPPFITR